MKLLGDMGHVESNIGPFGDSVGVGCKIGTRFVPNIS
jgi:hypothetical protein